jgi:uncharacterized membrane protein YhhN
MTLLFKNLLYFSIVYFAVFIIDSYVKINIIAFPYRYISKALLIFLLVIFFLFNRSEEELNKKPIVTLALLSFMVGDVFFTGVDSNIVLIIGATFFAIGKVLYAIRFANKRDFNILKLIPFLLFCFIYMCCLMMIIYDNLGHYFLPLLLFLFVVMIQAQFAYLRKNEVNRLSYWLVLIGVILSMFSDSLTILKQFYDNEIAYNNITIMLFYGLSQYFIVIGIIKEKKLSFIIKKNS